MRVYLLSLLVVLSTLMACSTAQKTASGSIQIVADVGANQNTATAVDIVFVYDINAIRSLPSTSGAWFEQKAALMNGLASGIDVISLQVPPASSVNVTLPQRSKDAIGVYSYSNYIDIAGQAVGNLRSDKKITIRLMPERVVYSGG